MRHRFIIPGIVTASELPAALAPTSFLPSLRAWAAELGFTGLGVAAIDLLHGVKHPEPAVKADAAPAKTDAPAAPAASAAPSDAGQPGAAKPN